jgi:PAS domain S-box-containing protein
MTIPVLGLGAIAISTFLLLTLAIATLVVDRRLSAQAAALETSERALRAQQQFLRAVIDANPHLVFARDWDGQFTLANKALAEVYGTTPENLVGKRDADFNPDQEQVARFRLVDREVMSTGEARLAAEELVTSATTGQARWFQTVKVPLVYDKGASPQVLGISTDITQRKRLEDQLRQAQKMEAIGRLAGGVAHDFNNILTAIIGHVDLLLEEEQEGGGRRVDLIGIKQAAERAAGLTHQLLAFSRKQVLQPKVLDLNALVNGTDQLLRRVIGEDVELRTVARPGLGAVEADPGQLEQVLVNLAVNARDAMPSGGRLTIEITNVELDQSYTRAHPPMAPGPYVLLTVSDTGVGMSAEIRAHIFEPFFTTKPSGKGTGLGLATVYGIVKQSGGYIWAESEPGCGATFRIYLPRIVTGAPAAAPAGAMAAEGGSETVLVVEDEDVVRALTSKVLQKRGYQVLVASSGPEALGLASRHPGAIHLLVTDVIMPRMSGRELARRFATLRPEAKVIYVSGYPDDAIIRHGVLESGLVFLQKPFAPEALAAKVREVLDGATPRTPGRHDGTSQS